MPIAGLPEPGRSYPWRFPSMDSWALPNGLRVVSAHLAGQPLASVDLVLPAPITSEPDGLDGLATLLAAALAAGPAPDVASSGYDLAAHALADLPDVTADAVGIRMRVAYPASELRHGLNMLRGTLRSPFSGHRIEPLVKAQLRRLGTVGGSAGVRETDELHAALFGRQQRLGRSWRGLASTVANIGPDEINTFFRKWVQPHRATLIVAGDLANDHLRQELRSVFGDWADEPTAAAFAIPEIGLPHHRVVLVEQPQYTQVHLMLGALIPGPGDPHWPAVVCTLHFLAGAQMALMDTVLRERYGFTFGVRLLIEAIPGGSVAIIRAFVSSRDAAAALLEMHNVLNQMRKVGCSAADRDRTVRSLRDSAPRQLQTSKAVAGALAEASRRGQSHRYPAELHDAFCGVSASDMSGAAARHLSPRTLTCVVSGPPDALRPVAAVASAICEADDATVLGASRRLSPGIGEA